MSRSPQDVRVRFSAHRRVPRPARRQGLRPSASLHPSAVTHRRSRLAFAGIGLAAGAGLAGTVAVSAPAAGFGAVNHRTILHPAAAPPVATTTRREPHPAGVAPVRASRTQGRQPLTRQVTRLVSRTIPVAPPFSGDASWYGPGFEGHSTANGDRYDSSLLTAASKTLPLGTRLQVCHNGACVTVLVNDRGPYVGDRVLDLSRAAAADIRLVDAGVGYVTATPIETRQVTETVTETVPAATARR